MLCFYVIIQKLQAVLFLEYSVFWSTWRIVKAGINNDSLSNTFVTASSVNAFRKQLNAVNLEKFLIVA